MTTLSAKSSYNNENRVCSSRVMELPDVAENSLRAASEKQYGVAHSPEPCIIALDEDAGNKLIHRELPQRSNMDLHIPLNRSPRKQLEEKSTVRLKMTRPG